MTTLAVIVVALVAGAVALTAVAAVRDVRVARWTQTDPRLDRQARREAQRKVRQQDGPDA